MSDTPAPINMIEIRVFPRGDRRGQFAQLRPLTGSEYELDMVFGEVYQDLANGIITLDNPRGKTLIPREEVAHIVVVKVRWEARDECTEDHHPNETHAQDEDFHHWHLVHGWL